MVMERSGVARYLSDVLESTRHLVDDLMNYADDLLQHGDKIQRDVVHTTRTLFLVDRDSAKDGGGAANEAEQVQARAAELPAKPAELCCTERTNTIADA